MPRPRELRIPLTGRTAQLLTLVAGLALCGAVLYGQTKVNNTAASLVNKTLVTQQDAQTITGLYSYSRGTNTPFAVPSGSARVDNLNAQYLSGAAYGTGVPGISGGFATTFFTTAATSITLPTGGQLFAVSPSGYAMTAFQTGAMSITFPTTGVLQAQSSWTAMTVPMLGTALSLTGVVTVGGNASFAGSITGLTDLYTVDWVDYSGSSTVTGWSSTTTKVVQYKKVGKFVFVSFQIAGTSNATAATFTLPFALASGPAIYFPQGRTQDNGGLVAAGTCRAGVSAGSTVDCYKDTALSAFTNVNTKEIIGQFFYESST